MRDQDGDALSGVTVAFAVTAGGGTLSAASVTTDVKRSGRINVDAWLSTAGTNTVTATASGITAPITFTATAEDAVDTGYGDYLADESFAITQSIYYAVANTSDRIYALRAAQIDVYTLPGVEQVSERITLHSD